MIQKTPTPTTKKSSLSLSNYYITLEVSKNFVLNDFKSLPKIVGIATISFFPVGNTRQRFEFPQ